MVSRNEIYGLHLLVIRFSFQEQLLFLAGCICFTFCTVLIFIVLVFCFSLLVPEKKIE